MSRQPRRPNNSRTAESIKAPLASYHHRVMNGSGGALELRLPDQLLLKFAGPAQVTGSSRPVSDACLMVSRKRCRSTATSNVGRRFCPVRTASANRA